MNDETLKELLGALKVPQPDAGATRRALHRATVALANRDEVGATEFPGRFAFGLRRWAAGGAALCLAIFAAMYFPSDDSEFTPAAQRVLLSQMETLFPGQLRAVIERGDDVSIELCDRPEAVSDQPVVVTFRKPGKAIRVLSYSGRQVCLQLAGEEVCFEPLVTKDGDVILAGDNFVWTGSDRDRIGDYRVRSSTLEGPL